MLFAARFPKHLQVVHTFRQTLQRERTFFVDFFCKKDESFHQIKYRKMQNFTSFPFAACFSAFFAMSAQFFACC